MRFIVTECLIHWLIACYNGDDNGDGDDNKWCVGESSREWLGIALFSSMTCELQSSAWNISSTRWTVCTRRWTATLVTDGRTQCFYSHLSSRKMLSSRKKLSSLCMLFIHSEIRRSDDKVIFKKKRPVRLIFYKRLRKIFYFIWLVSWKCVYLQMIRTTQTFF